jgi:phage baseplate assembly protein W
MAIETTAEKYTSTIKRDELFSDLFCNMDMHPGKKDLARQVNENAVKRSIVNLLLTDFHERIYQPYLGANLKYLLFEPADTTTLSLMRERIEVCIAKFEPRANILNISIVPTQDEQQMNVTVVFSIINTNKPVTLNLVLNRVR